MDKAGNEESTMIMVANFHTEASMCPASVRRFVIMKGMVMTLKEAADIRDRDPKDLE